MTFHSRIKFFLLAAAIFSVIFFAIDTFAIITPVSSSYAHWMADLLDSVSTYWVLVIPALAYLGVGGYVADRTDCEGMFHLGGFLGLLISPVVTVFVFFLPLITPVLLVGALFYGTIEYLAAKMLDSRKLKNLPKYEWDDIQMADVILWNSNSTLGEAIAKKFIAERVSAADAEKAMQERTDNAEIILEPLGCAFGEAYAERIVARATIPDGQEGTPFAIGSWTRFTRHLITIRNSRKAYSVIMYRVKAYEVIG